MFLQSSLKHKKIPSAIIIGARGKIVCAFFLFPTFCCWWNLRGIFTQQKILITIFPNLSWFSPAKTFSQICVGFKIFFSSFFVFPQNKKKQISIFAMISAWWIFSPGKNLRGSYLCTLAMNFHKATFSPQTTLEI